MKFKLALFLIFLSLLMVTGIFITYYYFRSHIKTETSKIVTQPTLKPEYTVWTDQSDYSFSYPKLLQLNPHDEDKENYSHVELTSDKNPGSVTVWVKDTDAETVDDWATQNNYNGAIDTTLGGEPAKKILSGSGEKIATTAAIYKGYLYLVEADMGTNDYWNSVYSEITGNFAFTSSEKKEKTTSPQYSNSFDDEPVEEEIIE